MYSLNYFFFFNWRNLRFNFSSRLLLELVELPESLLFDDESDDPYLFDLEVLLLEEYDDFDEFDELDDESDEDPSLDII